jgi:3'(2'), 5'-bisphosphate nucleotidase
MSAVAKAAIDPDNKLLMDIVALAHTAGKAIMEVYSRADLGQTSKPDDSPLTAADMASHHIIVAGLAALTPGIPVLSEEAAGIDYETRKRWPRYWLVDPLDGTREFIKRNGEFTVNIALVENGRPVLGVVYAPVLDMTYYAAEGVGAYKMSGSEPGKSGSGFSPTESANPASRTEVRPTPIHAVAAVAHQPLKVVASRSHSDARTQALLAKLGQHECISMGSSLKLCLVAEGAAHFYPRLGPTMEWDTAAAHAVVNEAGGKVCDRAGAELHYNKPDLHNPEFYVYAVTDGTLPQLIGNAND